jgi:hypothetical protein
MSCDIEAAAAPRRIWRVGRTPDAWGWPDWRFAGPDGTFGHRFDDPRGEYRVLYASSERFGAFVEALAPYRPHPALLEARRHLVDSGAAEGLAPGTLPAGWLASRTIGEAQPRGAFADIGHSRSLRLLRDRLGADALAWGVDELDAAAIRLSAPRALTQAVSRIAFDCVHDDGSAQFAGIRYRSRLGDEIDNWAIFERPADPPVPAWARSAPVAANDPDLVAALKHLGIELV